MPHIDVNDMKINIWSIPILYSDLSDYEKGAIIEQIKQGNRQGEVYTLSCSRDCDVLLKCSI